VGESELEVEDILLSEGYDGGRGKGKGRASGP